MLDAGEAEGGDRDLAGRRQGLGATPERRQQRDLSKAGHLRQGEDGAAGHGQEGAGGGRSCSGEAEEARRWQQVEAGARRGGSLAALGRAQVAPRERRSRGGGARRGGLRWLLWRGEHLYREERGWMRGRGSHGREEEQGRERRRSSVGSAAAGGALSCLLGDEHGRQGAEALREREERCSGTRGLLMLSRVAWTGKATGRRSVLTIHSGSSRGGKRRIEQRREKEARPRALVGGRWIWEDPEVVFECGGGGVGIFRELV